MSRVATTSGAYEITADWWGVETTNGTSEEHFKSPSHISTSLTTSKRPAKSQGYAVEEEVNEEDGSIRLVVRKWVNE